MTARQRTRLVMALSAVFVILWVAWLAKAALLPFIFGALLAYLLSPMVDLLVRFFTGHGRDKPWVRTAAILIIYGAIIGFLIALSIIVVPWVARNVQQLFEQRIDILQKARMQLDWFLDLYRRNVPPELREQSDRWIDTFAMRIETLAGGVIQRSVGLFTQTLAIIIGFFALPLWLFFVLRDQRKLSLWFYGLVPPSWEPDVRQVVQNATRVLGSYFKMQLVLGLVVGIATGIGLVLAGAPYPLPLAIIAGLTEIIPIAGPVIGAAVGLVVTLALEPGWTVLWVGIVYFAVQQLENQFLVPRLQGQATQVHPALVLVLLVVAGQIAGFLGVITVVPFYAIVRNTFVYFYRRLGDPVTPPAELMRNNPRQKNGAA